MDLLVVVGMTPQRHSGRHHPAQSSTRGLPWVGCGGKGIKKELNSLGGENDTRENGVGDGTRRRKNKKKRRN